MRAWPESWGVAVVPTTWASRESSASSPLPRTNTPPGAESDTSSATSPEPAGRAGAAAALGAGADGQVDLGHLQRNDAGGRGRLGGDLGAHDAQAADHPRLALGVAHHAHGAGGDGAAELVVQQLELAELDLEGGAAVGRQADHAGARERAGVAVRAAEAAHVHLVAADRGLGVELLQRQAGGRVGEAAAGDGGVAGHLGGVERAGQHAPAR